jgi:hypothetical protein
MERKVKAAKEKAEKPSSHIEKMRDLEMELKRIEADEYLKTEEAKKREKRLKEKVEKSRIRRHMIKGRIMALRIIKLIHIFYWQKSTSIRWHL